MTEQHGQKRKSGITSNITYLQKNITEEDVKEFFRYCKAQRLNPYDLHLQKYGDAKPVIVISKYAFLKRAERSGKFAGYRAGVIVSKDGKLTYREGSIVLKGETLVGGWAEVFRTDWKVPAKVEVSLDEYLRKDKNGKPFPMWKEKPATMIRKVAMVHALREAFPNEVGGLEVVKDENTEVITETQEQEEFYYTFDEKPITDNQRKLIWKLAKEKFSTEKAKEKLHEIMESEFNKTSSKELTAEEADTLIKILQEKES